MVFVVVLFLQNWRASLIPLVSVPVSLIGTFAAMTAFGFSINNLSLFGLVLAIGIVVDDAIVVVENVERHIAEGLSPADATHKAMDEVSGAVIAIALVLSAVFIPTAFISGITGKFYQQFALTIAVSTLISAFNSLTLSPALCALLLQPHHAPKDIIGRVMHGSVDWLFRGFNRVFEGGRANYVRVLGRVLRHCGVDAGGLCRVAGADLVRLPQGADRLHPVPGQGQHLLLPATPDGASLQRTELVSQQVVQIADQHPRHRRRVRIRRPVAGLAGQQRQRLQHVHPPEPVRGAGEGGPDGGCHHRQPEEADRRGQHPGGLRGSRRHAARWTGWAPWAGSSCRSRTAPISAIRRCRPPPTQLIGAALAQTNEIPQALSTFRAGVPQVFLDVDRAKAESMHVPLDAVWDTLSIYLGSLYVNDFTLYGRPYHVTAQADAPFRAKPSDVKNLKTRNASGEMVPLGTLVKVKDINAPVLVGHYNMFPTAEITRQHRAGRQLQRCHPAHGGPGRQGPAARHEDRMDRADACCKSWPATPPSTSSRSAC